MFHPDLLHRKLWLPMLHAILQAERLAFRLYDALKFIVLFKILQICDCTLQSVSWILAEFCYNRSPQGPYTGTCTILQETINGFLCPLIVFRKM